MHTEVNHLFRHEYGKLVSVLTKTFGPHHLALVEDVVQDTLLKALVVWKLKGQPTNPSAWLFTVARNKALDYLRKEKHQQNFVHNISPLLHSEYTASSTLHELINDYQIEDEQLRMMFVCCHPGLPQEAQVALILKTLCGFSIAEIANAFLTTEETINKRLYRAREKLRKEKIAFEPPVDINWPERLKNVLTSIYLVFNEGYHARHSSLVIREDLVEESLRLGNLLTMHQQTQTPETYALLALMCFHSARLYERINTSGAIVQLKNQDRTQWNHSLIVKGINFLNRAAHGETLTAYHLEAAIAYEHCIAKTYSETNWRKIDDYYQLLIQVRPAPLLSFQHAVVKAERFGPAIGLEELARIEGSRDLQKNHFLFIAKGEWLAALHKKSEALESFRMAKSLTQSTVEKDFIQLKINSLSA